MNIFDIQIYTTSTLAEVDTWEEQIIGNVIKPAYEEYGDKVERIWITRYMQPYPAKEGHTPPENMELNESKYLYLTFRAQVQEDSREAFCEEVIQLVKEHEYYIGPEGWSSYDLVGDLGNNRFIREDATDKEREVRANLVFSYMDSVARLIINALIFDEELGKWKKESNSDKNNSERDYFQSLHHLFCNATKVPVSVLVTTRKNQVSVITRTMMEHVSFTANPLQTARHEIFLDY